MTMRHLWLKYPNCTAYNPCKHLKKKIISAHSLRNDAVVDQCGTSLTVFYIGIVQYVSCSCSLNGL